MQTTALLEFRKQTFKLRMFRNIWRMLIATAFVIIAFFAFNLLSFSWRNEFSWIAKTWRYKWFLSDGWLNVVYSVDVLFILLLWRPTADNRRYGLEELASTEEEAPAT